VSHNANRICEQTNRFGWLNGTWETLPVIGGTATEFLVISISSLSSESNFVNISIILTTADQVECVWLAIQASGKASKDWYALGRMVCLANISRLQNSVYRGITSGGNFDICLQARHSISSPAHQIALLSSSPRTF